MQVRDPIEGLCALQASWGVLNLKMDPRENVPLISTFWKKDSMGLPYTSASQERHYLHYADAVPMAGRLGTRS